MNPGPFKPGLLSLQTASDQQLLDRGYDWPINIAKLPGIPEPNHREIYDSKRIFSTLARGRQARSTSSIINKGFRRLIVIRMSGRLRLGYPEELRTEVKNELVRIEP